MAVDFNDRRAKKDDRMAKQVMQGATGNLKAKCGHEDPLGYFAGTVCRKCANKGYKKATGR